MKNEQPLLASYAEDSEALFSSVEKAVRFAWSVDSRSETVSTLGRLQGTGREGKLSGDDRVGQSAMIKRHLEQLRALEQALLYVRLGPRSMKCFCSRPCCSGYTTNLQYQEAVGKLADAAVEVLSGSVTVYRQRAMMVRKWGGEKKIFLDDVADQVGVHRSTMSRHWGLVKPWLHKQYGRALHNADLSLRGIVGPENVDAVDDATSDVA